MREESKVVEAVESSVQLSETGLPGLNGFSLAAGKRLSGSRKALYIRPWQCDECFPSPEAFGEQYYDELF